MLSVFARIRTNFTCISISNRTVVERSFSKGARGRLGAFPFGIRKSEERSSVLTGL